MQHVERRLITAVTTMMCRYSATRTDWERSSPSGRPCRYRVSHRSLAPWAVWRGEGGDGRGGGGGRSGVAQTHRLSRWSSHEVTCSLNDRCGCRYSLSVAVACLAGPVRGARCSFRAPRSGDVTGISRDASDLSAPRLTWPLFASAVTGRAPQARLRTPTNLPSVAGGPRCIQDFFAGLSTRGTQVENRAAIGRMRAVHTPARYLVTPHSVRK